MAPDNLSGLVEKYSGNPESPGPGTVSYTCKVSVEARCKLGFIAEHFGVKKTPLVGEILESAINDLFEQISDDMDENAQEAYAHEMAEIQNRY